MEAPKKIEPRHRLWDWLASLILLCAVVTSASRLSSTQWADGLHVVQTVAVLGVIIGFVIGRTRFTPRESAFVATAYGTLIIFWQLAQLQHIHVEYKERLEVVNSRVFEAAQSFFQGEKVSDAFWFVAFMAVVFWIISVYSGYSLNRRGSAWWALIPAGTALMIVQIFDRYVPRRIWYLIFFLFFALLLLARVNFILRQKAWLQKRVLIAPDIGLDWVRYTLYVTVVLLAFSWAVPALAETLPPAQQAWAYIRRPWLEFQERVDDAFASLRSTVGFVSDTYGSTLTLGLGSPLTDQVVFSVEASASGIPGVRYYWRAHTYDWYENGQWKSTLDETKALDPENPDLKLPEWEGRWESVFKVRVFNSIVTLYTPTQPLWVSRPAQAILGYSEDGTADLVALKSQKPLGSGKEYDVRASVAAATEAQLRAAGTDYPQWILDHYLQMPPSPNQITARTLKLAEDITRDLDNPYDKAEAITQFLRDYKYSEVIDNPPDDQEVIDWWLFDYREGFCQYYATSEVVLLRSLGIPARLAVGYAQGEFLPKTQAPGPSGYYIPDPEGYIYGGGTFLVRQRQAHAWPEVFFPGIGWVEFEPTASQLPISRASGEDYPRESNFNPASDLMERLRDRENRPLGDENINPLEAASQGYRISPWLFVGAALVLIPIIVLAVLYIRRRPKLPKERQPIAVRLERSFRRLGIRPPDFIRRWAYYASLSTLGKAYQEINRALKRLGKPAESHDTPAERAASLEGILPAAREAIRDLLAEYQVNSYSTSSGNDQTAWLAGKEIRRQSYQALFQRWFSRFQEPMVDTRARWPGSS